MSSRYGYPNYIWEQNIFICVKKGETMSSRLHNGEKKRLRESIDSKNLKIYKSVGLFQQGFQSLEIS